MPVTLRPTDTNDEAFLFTLYCSTREEEIAAWGWSDIQRETFLRMQFQAQRRHYQTLAVPAEQSIVCCEGQPIGWIVTIHDRQTLRLAEIALLPEQRNSGIGTALIQELLTAAARTGSVVQLHVLRSNRVISLYQRLGFRAVADDGLYLQMEWYAGTEQI
jgi:ribosomal protein S18 acetylase RimI-like enzyme